MNGLRRFLLVVYSLLLIAAAGGLIGLTWDQDRKLDFSMGDDFNLQAFVASNDTWKVLFTLMCGAVALFGLFTLLVAIVRPKRIQSGGSMRMRQADGGTVEVTSAAVENLLREELQSLPDVRSLSPRVRLNNGAVETFLDAVIEPGASIASVTGMLGSGVAQVLRDQVGVTNVRRPQIKITYDESAAPRHNAGQRRPDAGRPLMRDDPPPARPERDDVPSDEPPSPPADAPSPGEGQRADG